MEKLENRLKKIFADANRDDQITNRSYYVKAVNEVLGTGLVSIKVCELGKVWESKGHKYNLEVKAVGWSNRVKINGRMTANEVLRTIGKLLLNPEVKEKIRSTVSIPHYCEKCQGLGIIPAFHYYCSGICFDCCGSGMDLKNKSTIVLKGNAKANSVTSARSFCLQFSQKGFFPEDQSKMERLFCTAFQGHATAEEWVLKDAEFYYLGQPVCRSSTWWKIPFDQYREFVTYYSKAFKTQLPTFNFSELTT